MEKELQYIEDVVQNYTNQTTQSISQTAGVNISDKEKVFIICGILIIVALNLIKSKLFIAALVGGLMLAVSLIVLIYFIMLL